VSADDGGLSLASIARVLSSEAAYMERMRTEIDRAHNLLDRIGVVHNDPVEGGRLPMTSRLEALGRTIIDRWGFHRVGDEPRIDLFGQITGPEKSPVVPADSLGRLGADHGIRLTDRMVETLGLKPGEFVYFVERDGGGFEIVSSDPNARTEEAPPASVRYYVRPHDDTWRIYDTLCDHDAVVEFSTVQEARAKAREMNGGVDLPVWEWDEPTPGDAFPADPDGWADAKGVVLDEYNAALGKEGLVYTLWGSDGDEAGLYFDPPVRVRVIETDRAAILGDQDGYIDPRWNVEVISALPAVDRRGRSTVGLVTTTVAGKPVWIGGAP